MPLPTRRMHSRGLSTDAASFRFPVGSALDTLTARLILW